MILLLLLLFCVAPAWAQSLPEPSLFGDEKSVSILVVRARPEQPGIRQVIATALAGAKERDGDGSLASLLTSVMSGKSLQSLATAALPLQYVRVDQNDGKGRLLSTTALTVAGWRGLQALVYAGMLNQSDGKPYPVRAHRGESVVLRKGWEVPENLMVLARTRGTFLNCSTPELAQKAIDSLLGSKKAPAGPLWQAYAGLAKEKDAYGALINKDGTLLRVVQWAGRSETERVRRKIGPERFDRVANSVDRVSWEAQVISDDRLDLEMRYLTGEVKELHKFWEDAHDVLKSSGQIANFAATPQGNGLTVRLSVTGLRPDVRNFLSTLRL